MKVIVFGGSGFIGSHVADYLTNNGHEVTIFDTKSSPYLLPNQEMIVGNLLDIDTVSKAIKDCDYAYNFAGIADLDDATVRPLDTIQQNIVGTGILLETAREHKLKRIVFASTIYVYSDKGGFYRCSKQAAELYIEEYSRKFELNYTILRYGTVYGPRADDTNSIYRYLKQAMETGKITCNGTGDEIREYVHVRDVARLSVAILDNEYRNQYVIITGHNSMLFRDMLYMIREILNNKVDIKFTGIEDKDHYSITPYSYVPKVGQKLVSNYYIDMGQGLLECVNEIYNPQLSKERYVD